MAIVPTDVPFTSQRNTNTIRLLTETYPVIRSEVIATTAFQRPIIAIAIGTGPRKVLYSASHHANEWITTPVLLKFAEELAAALEQGGRIFGVPAQTLVKAATIYMVPMVDPDGVDLVTGAADRSEVARAARFAENYPGIPFPDGWKANLNGVDLNLQYPAGWLRAREIKFAQGFTRPGPRDFVGRAPLSQPEVKALLLLTEAVEPDLVLAFHTQGEVIYWQFGGIEVPGARRIGEEFARLSGYELADTPEESAYAGYKDWFIQRYRRPGYTIEAGLGENPLPLTQFDEIYRDTLGILTTASTGLPDK